MEFRNSALGESWSFSAPVHTRVGGSIKIQEMLQFIFHVLIRLKTLKHVMRKQSNLPKWKLPQFPGVRDVCAVCLWIRNYGGVPLARNVLAALVLDVITGITMVSSIHLPSLPLFAQ